MRGERAELESQLRDLRAQLRAAALGGSLHAKSELPSPSPTKSSLTPLLQDGGGREGRSGEGGREEKDEGGKEVGMEGARELTREGGRCGVRASTGHLEVERLERQLRLEKSEKEQARLPPLPCHSTPLAPLLGMSVRRTC